MRHKLSSCWFKYKYTYFHMNRTYQASKGSCPEKRIEQYQRNEKQTKGQKKWRLVCRDIIDSLVLTNNITNLLPKSLLLSFPPQIPKYVIITDKSVNMIPHCFLLTRSRTLKESFKPNHNSRNNKAKNVLNFQ